jgi:hypothetical protein
MASTSVNLPALSARLILRRAAFSDLASTTKSAKQAMSWAYEQMNLDMVDFDFVRMDDELGRETGWLALQCPVDELDGLIHLSGGITLGDPVGIKLQFNPPDDDGFKEWQFCLHVWWLASDAVAPNAVNLTRSDDGQKADDVGPDEVKNDQDDQGQDTQADDPFD